MYDIDEVLRLLDENRSVEDQKLGIQLAAKVKCKKAFFQPAGPDFGKKVWENCARVIANCSEEELEPYFEDMFIWIQDRNWPGAEIIYNKLKTLHNVVDMKHLIDVFSKIAAALDDTQWTSTLEEMQTWQF